jgi:hypothetical protein
MIAYYFSDALNEEISTVMYALDIVESDKSSFGEGVAFANSFEEFRAKTRSFGGDIFLNGGLISKDFVHPEIVRKEEEKADRSDAFSTLGFASIEDIIMAMVIKVAPNPEDLAAWKKEVADRKFKKSDRKATGKVQK